MGASAQGSPEGRSRATQKARLRASRIKAGVTSDTGRVTSARSADRFKGFQSFPAGLLSGVSFGQKISE